MTLSALHLVRHGETDWNSELRMQGSQDVPLNAKGLGQALRAAPSVAALGGEVIISSDLGRAKATAEIFAAEAHQGFSADARLRETDLGDWEGCTRAEVQTRWPGQWERWRHHGVRFAPPGGESRIEVAARACQVVDELDAGGHGSAVLVTHGGTIVAMTGRLLALPEDDWVRFVGVGNCHWVTLHRVAGTWRLQVYNGGLGGIVLPSPFEDVADD